MKRRPQITKASFCPPKVLPWEWGYSGLTLTLDQRETIYVHIEASRTAHPNHLGRLLQGRF